MRLVESIHLAVFAIVEILPLNLDNLRRFELWYGLVWRKMVVVLAVKLDEMSVLLYIDILILYVSISRQAERDCPVRIRLSVCLQEGAALWVPVS